MKKLLTALVAGVLWLTVVVSLSYAMTGHLYPGVVVGAGGIAWLAWWSTKI